MRLEGLPRYKESSTETPAFLNRFSPRRPYTLHPTCLESGLGPTASERAAARPSPCRPMMAEKLRLEVADRRLHEGLTIAVVFRSTSTCHPWQLQSTHSSEALRCKAFATRVSVAGCQQSLTCPLETLGQDVKSETKVQRLYYYDVCCFLELPCAINGQDLERGPGAQNCASQRGGQ